MSNEQPAVDGMRQKLKNCELRSLFIEDLGWNHHRATPLVVQDDGVNYVLNAIAEKHGMVAFECQPGPSGQIPDYPVRGKIERQVAKSAHEHIVVFINQDRTMQTWQWVRREKGKPTARREHPYVCSQPGDSLIQKLRNLMISLEEEEKLTIVDVTGKVRQAFDVDRVTKRFYDRFKDEHKVFLSFIEGITAVADREWYASLMLNRLMFIYFIQKKKFLDGDMHYLRHRLQAVRESHGKDKFHSFYRKFLRRLFHEGLAQRKDDRSAELNSLLGSVPYLNGGLFDTHQLEQDNPDIHIPDQAFEKLFDFFDAYQWHLDERQLRADNEINPDVLGYIFEKYINQKQMGAYYTKEDITEYISKSTIVPFLFDSAEKKCAIAFRPDGAVWRLLRDEPDRYIYPAMSHGIAWDARQSPPRRREHPSELPEDISAGINDVSKRMNWNRPAQDECALPTETWREVVARRTRCQEVRAKLAAGDIHSINDLITYNLDLRQFAQDVIETSEGPDLLRAFYRSIEGISVLDPTCGSGAFLFAALNILEPLYEACLDRMETFVDELDRSGEKHHPEKFSDFRKVLERANDRAKHPSRSYFILKSIVLNNLFGVDIMPEAVEICKLRLFLKLAAQVERVEDVEPLPDIDFNIRTGNTLVGFTSLEALRQAMTVGKHGQHRLLSDEDRAALKRIDESAELADKAFRRFREQQTDQGMQASEYAGAKTELQTRLAALRMELDHCLFAEYGIDLGNNSDFETWRSRHQPFHWFVEFYGIMRGGGFDVVIGNPPYVEYREVKNRYTVRGFVSFECGDLYAFCTERGTGLLARGGYLGLIVPISMFGTDGFASLQQMVTGSLDPMWTSFFSNRPSQLFEGAQKRITIMIGRRASVQTQTIYTTRYLRWRREEFGHLFSARIEYAPKRPCFSVFPASLEKIGSELELSAFRRILARPGRLADGIATADGYRVYYTRKFGYFLAFLDFVPAVTEIGTGKPVPPSELKDLSFDSRECVFAAVAALSSSTFFWFWNVLSDCRNLNRRDLLAFRADPKRLPTTLKQVMSSLGDRYLRHLKSSSKTMTKSGLKIETFEYAALKPTIDSIDHALATYYGFTQEELDFITNYDIKYRMGTDSDAEDE